MINIYDYVACPICKEPLNKVDGFVECTNHGRYPVTPQGVPMLFSDSGKQEFDHGEIVFADEKRASLKRFIKKTFLRMPKLYFGNSLHDRLKKKYVMESSKDSVILNFGSGHESLFERDNFINFDIFPHNNAHVAGDGHELPFLTDSIDVVWLCAVLEHIRQPFQVMQEVHRVLKPGGHVLISVPFIQEQHGFPHDYFRYTPNGMRSICHQFDEVESGITYTGPFGTLIQVVTSIPSAFVSNSLIRYVLRFVFAWLLSPLLLLDLFHNKKENTPIFGGVCFLGKK